MASQVPPKTALGKAVRYCRNQKEKLEAFLLDGRLEIDNNRSERSIKPFVMGRKAWLFSNTPRGATASAVIYRIVETAKEYLTWLFEQLPNARVNSSDSLDVFLPWSDNVPLFCKTHS